MQFETATIPQRKLDSSSSPAAAQEGDGTVHSAEQSPSWNTPSSTRTLAHFSSPDLPSLPSLPRLGQSPQAAASDSSHNFIDYFTASWGSPYPYTPTQALGFSVRQEHSRVDNSDNIENESPDLRFG